MGAAISASVHGLSGEPALPDWPPLTQAELAPILARYPGLGLVRDVAWHSPRPFAASGLVACAHATVFVKRHPASVRSPADLAEEHALLAHLRAHGAPVAQVLATEEGTTCIAANDSTYEVHPTAPGHDLYRNAVSWEPLTNLTHAQAAGRALATLHQAADSYVAPPRTTGLLVADFRIFAAPDPIAALASRLAAEPRLAAALAGKQWQTDIARTLLPFHARLTPHLPALTPLWTHNDLHASNLLWSAPGNDVTCVLDFGLANRTSAAFDLATAIERNAIAWLHLSNTETNIGRPAIARALINGYAHLPQGQAAALPHLLPLVHAEFALSELAYFHGILGDAHRANMAYHDFLLGHATWFTTQHGQDFLDALHHAVS